MLKISINLLCIVFVNWYLCGVINALIPILLDYVTYKKPDLFFVNYNCDKKIRVNQGGTYSGKTVTIVDVLLNKAIEKKRQILVAGQDVPNLKSGSYQNALDLIYGKGNEGDVDYIKPNEVYKKLFRLNKTDRTFYCKNGSFIKFKSYKDAQDAKNGKHDIVFINECNGVNYEICFQLILKANEEVYLDYNPTSRFWVHERIISRKDAKLIISDHRHNPFLSKDKHEEIERIKDEDLELWRIYARGKTGNVKEVIYNKWKLVDELPNDYCGRWLGLDFGYTNSKTAIVEIRLSHGELYCKEVCYNIGMQNEDIFNIIKNEYPNEYDKIRIVADIAERKSIDWLRNRGLYNIIGSESKHVEYGISVCKIYKINVVNSSVNFLKEIQTYKYKKDKNDNITNEVVKINDHLLDAMRYVVQNEIKPKGEFKGKTTLGTRRL